ATVGWLLPAVPAHSPDLGHASVPIPAVWPARCADHEPPEPVAGASVPLGIDSIQADSSYKALSCALLASSTRPAGTYGLFPVSQDHGIGPPILRRSGRSFFAQWTTVTLAVPDYKLRYCWTAFCRSPASPASVYKAAARSWPADPGVALAL